MDTVWMIVTAVALITLCKAEKPREGLVVATQHGPVRGTIRYADGVDRPVHSFFGIPYARSPDYSFRFHYPVDPWEWSEVKNVTDEKVPFCYQDREVLAAMNDNAPYKAFIDDDTPLNEDCLSVNVFTPNLPSKKAKDPLPVIVWIHGGSFQTTASTSKMWMLPAFEDVVLVTVQYRLGVFGFLSFDDQWGPPNSAFHDQVKALEWVRDNIAAFGGNPNLVTLFGQSAGGFATSAHAVSPLSKGLFHRVIASSGTLTVRHKWDSQQPEKAIKIARSVDCDFAEVPPISTCIRNRVTSKEMIEAARKHKLVFDPAPSGSFFPSSIDDLLKGLSPSVPFLIGVVSGEFDYILARKSLKEYLGPRMNKSIAESIIFKNLDQYYPSLRRNEKGRKEILSLYLGNATSWEKLVFGVLEYMNDAIFNWNIVKFADSAKDSGADVYFYNFSPKPSFYENKILNLRRPHDFKRADHGDDVPFFLGFPFLAEFSGKGLTFTEDEELLSRRMMKTLTTFAQTGVPSPTEEFNWPRYPSYANLDITLKTHEHFRPLQMTLWRRLLAVNENKNFENVSSKNPVSATET